MSDKEKIIFKHIAIEGILKSGKTKLANILSQKIGGKVIFDRVENPYLRDFYNEKETLPLFQTEDDSRHLRRAGRIF